MKDINELVNFAKSDEDVLAVTLFGSAVRRDNSDESDIDVCLVLKSTKKYSNIDFSKKRLIYLKNFDFDIQIYQQLPIYIRQRILKDNKMLFCTNENEMYNIAFKTIQEFNDFEHIYREYLQVVEYGR